MLSSVRPAGKLTCGWLKQRGIAKPVTASHPASRFPRLTGRDRVNHGNGVHGVAESVNRCHTDDREGVLARLQADDGSDCDVHADSGRLDHRSALDRRKGMPTETLGMRQLT